MGLSFGVTVSGATPQDTRAYIVGRDEWNDSHPDDQVNSAAELSEAILLERVEDWKKKEMQQTIAQRQEAWKNATDAQRAQIDAILGIE